MAGAPPPALLGILRGVLLAVVGSILLLLHRAAAPHVAVPGRIPGTSRCSDLERHPDNEPIPEVLVFGVEVAGMGAALRLPEARASVRDLLREERLEAVAGPILRRTAVAELIEDFEQADVAAGARAAGRPT